MDAVVKLNETIDELYEAIDKLNEAALKRIRAGLPLTDEEILELKRIVEEQAPELLIYRQTGNCNDVYFYG